MKDPNASTEAMDVVGEDVGVGGGGRGGLSLDSHGMLEGPDEVLFVVRSS